MKYTYLFGLLLTGVLLHAQHGFVPGFLITADGQRSEAYLLKQGRSYNPRELRYRLSERGAELTATPGDLRAFGYTEGGEYFVSATVPAKETDEAPRRLFLRQYVEGAADLFYSRDGLIETFYYRLGDRPIETLIYRSTPTKDGVRSVDLTYRTQLALAMPCSDELGAQLRQAGYFRKDLQAFVLAYNACIGAEAEVLETKGQAILRFGLTGGVEQRSFRYRHEFYYQGQEYAFVPDPSAYVKIDVETPLRFTQDRLSVFTGLAYRQVESTQLWQWGSTEYSRVQLILDQRSFALPLGLRWQFLPKDRWLQPFVESAGTLEAPLRSSRFQRRREVYRTYIHLGATFGGGLRFGKHLELAGYYGLGRNVLRNHPNQRLDERITRVTVTFRR